MAASFFSKAKPSFCPFQLSLTTRSLIGRTSTSWNPPSERTNASKRHRSRVSTPEKAASTPPGSCGYHPPPPDPQTLALLRILNAPTKRASP